MNYFQQEFKRKLIFNSFKMYFFVAIFLLVSIYISLESVKYIYKLKTLNVNTEKLKNNLNTLNTSLEYKKNEHTELSTEWGKEEYLRKVYPAIKEGEKMIILYDSTSTNSFEIISTSTDLSDISLVKRIKIFLAKYTNL